MRITLISTLLLCAVSAEAQVFKCTGADGQVAFSYTPCPVQDGVSEAVKVQASEVGTFATQEQIDQVNTPEQIQRARPKVTVVIDSSTEDPSTASGRLNRRLRQQEESLEQLRGEDTSGVTVVHDRSRESPLDRARRLKAESKALGIDSTSQAAPAAAPELSIPQIDDREVPYQFGQDPLKRRLEQISNKVNDPRPEDAASDFCTSGKPSRGVVVFRGEEIWPGMSRFDVTRRIGSPHTVNSLLVGQEQWVYRTSEKSIRIYIHGQCVRSIE